MRYTDLTPRIIIFLNFLNLIAGRERVAAKDESLECELYEFKCGDGSKCVDEMQVCDMIADCDDRSDEPAHCETFVCADGEVIAERFRCDGISDCRQGEDESSTTANCTNFLCRNGKKVAEKQVCDQLDDCDDKFQTDECDCPHTFSCANGRCVVDLLACDGIDDCGDNSDEADCKIDKFVCDDVRVVEMNLKCDGKADCEDTSDECKCPGTFQCDNGRCLSGNLRDNGVDDCGDRSDETIQYVETTMAALGSGSDETIQYEETTMAALRSGSDETIQYEETTMTTIASGSDGTTATTMPTSERATSQSTAEFMCAGGQTIGLESVCDGIDDCGDCTDEVQCITLGKLFFCESGGCVKREKRCDDTNDCPQGEDERDCFFENATMTTETPKHEVLDKETETRVENDATMATSQLVALSAIFIVLNIFL